jgi:hypothetical protein
MWLISSIDNILLTKLGQFLMIILKLKKKTIYIVRNKNKIMYTFRITDYTI